MSKIFKDYFWKEGIPYGINPLEGSQGERYKIVMDPYRKHITLEKYCDGNFQEIIYDSAFLNFRHLKNDETRAWHKTIMTDGPEKIVSHLRDQDDRLVFEETYYFAGNLCRECHVSSPHGIPLSIQRLYYKSLQDPYNGVILFDRNNHPVIFKEYVFDEDLNEFTDLIETKWDMQHFKVELFSGTKGTKRT